MPLLALLLAGCWSTDLPISDYTLIPLDNEYVRGGSPVVEKVTTGLSCPDDEPAVFYAAYNEELEGPAPVAVLMHSSTFDYVYYPKSDGPLAGEHYAGTESGDHRMSGSWGVKKVWETLGVYRQIEPTENNQGAMPAALINQGFIVLMPINCWGDLWHNDDVSQRNDVATEYIDRYGRTFAHWMIRVIQEGRPSFVTTGDMLFADRMDASSIHLVGLGDGARGVIDLLRHDDMPPITSILVDAPVDDLADWQSEYQERADGLERIFADRLEDPGLAWYSLEALADEGALDDVRVGVVYSAIDPQVPGGNLDDTLEALPDSACVHNTDQSGHVFTNSDSSLAGAMVDFMVSGERTSFCD